MAVDAVGLFFYITAVAYASKYGLNVKGAALFAGITPIVFNAIDRSIIASIFHSPLTGIFSPADFVTAALQLIFAFIIFKLMERNDDTLTAWWGIAITGGTLSYAIVPNLIKWMIS